MYVDPSEWLSNIVEELAVIAAKMSADFLFDSLSPLRTN